MIQEGTDSYYLKQNEPNKSCLLALREIILKQDKDVTETRKWGMPCFCYKGKMFAYLWTDKKTKEPYVLMVEGKHLHHPLLEQGDRARMKILRIHSEHDIPLDTVTSVLQEALELYKNGTITIEKV